MRRSYEYSVTATAYESKLVLAPSQRDEFPDTMDFSIIRKQQDGSNWVWGICLTNLSRTLTPDKLTAAMDLIMQAIDAQPGVSAPLTPSKRTWRKIMDLCDKDIDLLTDTTSKGGHSYE